MYSVKAPGFESICFSIYMELSIPCTRVFMIKPHFCVLCRPMQKLSKFTLFNASACCILQCRWKDFGPLFIFIFFTLTLTTSNRLLGAISLYCFFESRFWLLTLIQFPVCLRIINCIFSKKSKCIFSKSHLISVSLRVTI